MEGEIIGIEEWFLESIVDALNESFTRERPCSDKGVAPPWSATWLQCNHMGLSQSTSEESRLIVCARAINRLIEWATTYCGIITEHVEVEAINEEQENKIRETRLTIMLEKAIGDMERQLRDSAMEVAEVTLEIGEEVWAGLLAEAAQEVQRVYTNMGRHSNEYRLDLPRKSEYRPK